ncbi:MAG: adenosylcobinamide-phosphate synthase CbiB [Pseudomonadota bacterium]
MGSAGLLILALALDAVFGEPRWLWSRLPHPAVLMGRAVSWAEQRFNQGSNGRSAGAATLLGLGLFAIGVGALLSVHWVPELLAMAVLLAQRSLSDHVRDVARGLRRSIEEGRRAVSQIVGRDCAQMDQPAVARAAIESAAENLSDGVIAPAFWYLIGGLPGLMLYKMTNTADSMIGYLTPRYRNFGWAAARFDDVLNWVPARLTAGLIWALYGFPGQWRHIAMDAGQHRSPNAGWPEAAMARALDVALSGPRSYDGQLRSFPYVHETGRRDPGPPDIDHAVAALWRSWSGLVVACGCLYLVSGW